MTNSIDRRDFMKTSGAALGATAVLATGQALASDPAIPPGEAADMIFRGGPIVTMVESSPNVDAVAVKDGRILAAGSDSEVMALAGEKTEIIDLAGRTLLPAFIDAHGHFMNAPQVVTWANVSPVPVGPVKGIPDIIDALKAHVAKFDIKLIRPH